MPHIKIYSSSDCIWCDRAKDLFKKMGLPYEEVDLTDDQALWERLSEENSGWRTVPMIYVDGRFVGGYPEVLKLRQEGKLGA